MSDKNTDRGILATLADMPHVVNEGDEELSKVLSAIRDTGKKGSISIVLTITPNKGDENIKELTGVVKAAAPRRTPKPTMMFEQHDGTLARTDPNAMSFDSLGSIKEVASDAAPTQVKEAIQR